MLGAVAESTMLSPSQIVPLLAMISAAVALGFTVTTNSAASPGAFSHTPSPLTVTK